MEVHFYSEEAVADLFDDVLIRSIVEFRRALGLLDRNGLASYNPYTAEMRRALAVMEQELARRRAASSTPLSAVTDRSDAAPLPIG